MYFNIKDHNMFAVRLTTPTLGEYQFKDIVAKDITEAFVIAMSREKRLNLIITKENVLEVASANGYSLTDITEETYIFEDRSIN